MLVFADHLDFARTLLPSVSTWEPRRAATLQPPVRHLATRLQPDAAWHAGELAGPDFDRCLLVARSSHSQFDVLRDLATANRLPEGSTFCVAGSGLDFHGYRGRSWTAVAGNLHVSLVFAPGADIAHFGAVFMALPAVATAEAIEKVARQARPVGIKWVNDVVVAGAKVAGVIAHTCGSSTRVEQAVLGIGINVEIVPHIERSPFVPRAGALSELDPGVTQAEVLLALLQSLGRRYRAVLDGGAEELLAAYRDRSVVLGRRVEIHPDATHGGQVVSGRVKSIDDDLQLVLDGRSAPVGHGRLLVAAGESSGRNP